MVKAGPSFQSIHYGNNGDSVGCLRHDKVADIMARYYARFDKNTRTAAFDAEKLSEKQPHNSSYQRDFIPVETGTQNQPESVGVLLEKKRQADSLNLENIGRSRLKMEQTNNILENLGSEMKRLEVEGDFLRTVRNNLDEMDRNFWDWLR